MGDDVTRGRKAAINVAIIVVAGIVSRLLRGVFDTGSAVAGIVAALFIFNLVFMLTRPATEPEATAKKQHFETKVQKLEMRLQEAESNKEGSKGDPTILFLAYADLALAYQEAFYETSSAWDLLGKLVEGEFALLKKAKDVLERGLSTVTEPKLRAELKRINEDITKDVSKWRASAEQIKRTERPPPEPGFDAQKYLERLDMFFPGEAKQ